jgi:hypothetical protein
MTGKHTSAAELANACCEGTCLRTVGNGGETFGGGDDSNRGNRFLPVAFIDEPIEVGFDRAPDLEKEPHCPNTFTWRGQVFGVRTMLSEWRDYRRKGRVARNMTVRHLRAATRRGSWGVGRFHFRVATDSGRIFDLYYDRRPQRAGDRKGSWYVWRELRPR